MIDSLLPKQAARVNSSDVRAGAPTDAGGDGGATDRIEAAVFSLDEVAPSLPLPMAHVGKDVSARTASAARTATVVALASGASGPPTTNADGVSTVETPLAEADVGASDPWMRGWLGEPLSGLPRVGMEGVSAQGEGAATRPASTPVPVQLDGRPTDRVEPSATPRAFALPDDVDAGAVTTEPLRRAVADLSPLSNAMARTTEDAPDPRGLSGVPSSQMQGDAIDPPIEEGRGDPARFAAEAQRLGSADDKAAPPVPGRLTSSDERSAGIARAAERRVDAADAAPTPASRADRSFAAPTQDLAAPAPMQALAAPAPMQAAAAPAEAWRKPVAIGSEVRPEADVSPKPTEPLTARSAEPDRTIAAEAVSPPASERPTPAAQAAGSRPVAGLSAMDPSIADEADRIGALTKVVPEEVAGGAKGDLGSASPHPSNATQGGSVQAAGAASSLTRPVAEDAAVRIASAASDARGGVVELRLDPPELGSVRVSLSTAEGSAQALIVAERPETADLLRRHAELLARELASAGHGRVDVEVSTGGRQQASGGGERWASAASAETQEPVAEARSARSGLAGGLDLRV